MHAVIPSFNPADDEMYIYLVPVGLWSIILMEEITGTVWKNVYKGIIDGDFPESSLPTLQEGFKKHAT